MVTRFNYVKKKLASLFWLLKYLSSKSELIVVFEKSPFSQRNLSVPITIVSHGQPLSGLVR